MGAIAVDNSGNVFVADNENLRIREVSDVVETARKRALPAGSGGPAASATRNSTSPREFAPMERGISILLKAH